MTSSQQADDEDDDDDEDENGHGESGVHGRVAAIRFTHCVHTYNKRCTTASPVVEVISRRGRGSGVNSLLPLGGLV